MMKRSIFCVLFLAIMGVFAADFQLFDFESAQSPVKVLWNKEHATAELSGEWSSEGKQSLQIKAPAYDTDTMSVYYYPGVEFALPTRDWSQYKYLQFDLKVDQDETPFSILIQWGKRHERISAGYTFDKGVFRIKMNLYELLREPVEEKLLSIKSFEFHVTRPKTDFTVYVDNILLVKGKDDDVKLYDQVLSIEDPNNPKPVTDHKIIAENAGLAELLNVLKKEFSNKNFGVKVTSISEQVPFRNLEFSKHWDNKFNLSMAQNETRSLQAIFFRKPVESTETFSASCDIPGLEVKLERMAYLNLPSFFRLERRGFSPGWYADPILEMKESAVLEPEQWAQPLVVSVKTTAETKAGKYKGFLKISYLGEEFTLPLNVNVKDFAMPDTPSLPILLGIGTTNGKVDHDFWLDYRMNPHYSDTGNIYDKRQRKGAMDIEKLKELCDKGMSAFNLIYVNEMEFKYYGNSADRYLESIYKRYTDEYMEKLVEAGIADKAIIYTYDEVTVSGDTHEKEYNTVNKVLGALKERYGKYGVRIAATLRDCNDQAIHNLPADIWIPLATGIQKEAADNLVSLGKEVWWYHISWEVWSPIAWTRSITWTTLHRDYVGWLYYNVNGPWSKTGQCLDDSALSTWSGFSVPNLMMFGTGSLVYQDQEKNMRPSLRLINFREAMYDYDLASNLKNQIAELKNKKLGFFAKRTLRKAERLFSGDDWVLISELTDTPKDKDNVYFSQLLEKKRNEMLKMQEKINKIWDKYLGNRD